MKSPVLLWILSFGLAATAWPADGGVVVRSHVFIAKKEASSASGEDAELRPIKKRVGRAVTSTMEKINNPWFIVSQILVPLSVLLFSLMYVRRYRARQAAEAVVPNPSGGEAAKSERIEPEEAGKLPMDQREANSGDKEVRK